MMRVLRMAGAALGALGVTLMICLFAPLMGQKAQFSVQKLIRPVKIFTLPSIAKKCEPKKIIPPQILKVAARSTPKRVLKKERIPLADIRLKPIKMETVPLKAATMPAPLPVSREPVKTTRVEQSSVKTRAPVTRTVAKTSASAPGILELGSVDVPPSLKRYSPPPYPSRARGQGIEGKVLVRCVVTSGGKVRDPKILDAEPAGYFERAALKSVKKWTFVPARLNGQKVAVYVDIPLSFNRD